MNTLIQNILPRFFLLTTLLVLANLQKSLAQTNTGNYIKASVGELVYTLEGNDFISTLKIMGNLSDVSARLTSTESNGQEEYYVFNINSISY